MFNESPVVGGPLGFVAADWHLDAVRLVVGGLAEPGRWLASQQSLPLPASWAGCISQAELSVQGCSHMLPCDLGWLTLCSDSQEVLHPPRRRKIPRCPGTPAPHQTPD